MDATRAFLQVTFTVLEEVKGAGSMPKSKIVHVGRCTIPIGHMVHKPCKWSPISRGCRLKANMNVCPEC